PVYLLLTAPAPPALYTLSLHDALPIWSCPVQSPRPAPLACACRCSIRSSYRSCRRGRKSRSGPFPSPAWPDARRDSPCAHDWRRSEEHTSELQSLAYLVCRLLLEKKNR